MKAAEREALRHRVSEEKRVRVRNAEMGRRAEADLTTLTPRQRGRLLQDACADVLAKGVVDPRHVAREVLRTNGAEWVSACVDLEAHLADVARKLIHVGRNDELRGQRVTRTGASHKAPVLSYEEEKRHQIRRLDAETRLFNKFIGQMTEACETFKQDVLVEFLASLDTPCHVPDVGWKAKGALTADECVAVSRSYQGRAFTELQTAAQFEGAAEAMRAGGHATVAALAEARSV